MQGAQKLRSEAHLQVRRNDEVAAQRRRWTFYEAIKASCQPNRPLIVLPIRKGKFTETRHGKPAGDEAK
jgi:hypothetical protein